MRRLSIFLLLLAILSCNNYEKPDTEGYEAANYASFKRDSVKYVFDRINAQQRYSYYIQYLPIRKIGKLQVFQGDIIINSNIESGRGIDSMILDSEIVQPYKMIGVSPLSKERLWPRHEVRYVISENDDTKERISSIRQAIAAWRNLGIIFTELPEPSGDCIIFNVDRSHQFNLSPIGRVKGSQNIILRKDVSTGSIMHEIGHSLGLWHEHCRPDRDQHITIITANIAPSDLKEFKPIAAAYSYYLTNYDFNSIMHYDPYAFGKRGSDGKAMITIQTKPAGKIIGQRSAPSELDRAGIRSMYNLP